MERLPDRSLESIPVRDLCVAAEVSEPSFFSSCLLDGGRIDLVSDLPAADSWPRGRKSAT
jgi:hypothetical protein